jgi:RNA methyltransferase, TrmH family
MTEVTLKISSLGNPRIRRVVKLRQRSHRDELGLLLVEGYREIKRALDNRHMPLELFFCPACFQGTNEHALLERCRNGGARLFECTEPVFRKIAYRERPEGLLALAPRVGWKLSDVPVQPDALILVAESVEKPGNLGTLLRSADGAGVHAVLVCDRCTDLNNPNVVRASIGTLFSLPVVETTSDDALAWLHRHRIRTFAATPHAEQLYTDADMTRASAIVVGAEQVGLSDRWLNAATDRVRIPMGGQSDSLNVAAATTLLLYEAVRQRSISPSDRVPRAETPSG